MQIPFLGNPLPSKPAGWAEAVQPGLLLAPGVRAAAHEKSPARRTMDCRSPPPAGYNALTLPKAPAHRSLPGGQRQCSQGCCSPRASAPQPTKNRRAPDDGLPLAPRAGCYALTLLKAPAHRSLPVSEGSAAKAAARPGRPRRSPRKIAARRALCSCGTASGSSAVNKKSTVYPQASDSPVEERI